MDGIVSLLTWTWLQKHIQHGFEKRWVIQEANNPQYLKEIITLQRKGKFTLIFKKPNSIDDKNRFSNFRDEHENYEDI